jgi:ECF sigma factor
MSANDSGSVTHWLGATRRGPGAVEDEEDAALSAFDSCCRAATEGRFPCLDDRDDLWRLLVAITERKATDQMRRARRLKRAGPEARGDNSPTRLAYRELIRR